ncbi:MAG: hypothetical protein BJ554DRAFT_2835 [Olpidium bornovanus]|uniref:Uncharacterized protein n=1 Tax=Olpidium bornovanus TaxID=278681 RepID=A0A8H8DGB5_9FUNG|nr:MAG: hypothetical protein BJ554DRAFT_2835 [Olpidium bornovanus]
MLEENEQYLVNTRRMVAWDLRTSHASKTSRTQRLELPTEALTHGGRGTTGHRSATEEPSVEQSGSGNARTAVAVFAAALKERLAYIGKCTWTVFSRWMRELLLGRDDYVKLTGPGVVYLSGRRGVTGLQRIGVGMDRVAINLPARPTGPPPNRLKTAQRRAHTSDQVLDNPLRPDVPVAKDPLTGNDSTSGPKLITKSADEPLLKA